MSVAGPGSEPTVPARARSSMGTVMIRWLNWVVVLRPTTDLVGDETTGELQKAFESAWAESHQGIVINLSDVQLMNSLGFGLLAHCLALANRTHTKIAFCCLSPRLAGMF